MYKWMGGWVEGMTDGRSDGKNWDTRMYGWIDG